MSAGIHTIDATGKKLGRIATEAATVLMGKHTPSFAKNKEGDTSVKIEHASAIVTSEKKEKEKIYVRYSGYPGGLKKQKMSNLVAKKGYAESVRKAVYGMLPGNKLRALRMKRLIIEE